MAASKSSVNNEYHSMIDNNIKGCCWSKMCWLLVLLYQYTIGSCCYTPLKWLRVRLFGKWCCKNGASHHNEGLSEYEILSKIPLSETSQDSKWKRRSQIDEADKRMKQRLQHQFQDHIQKWTNINHRRFPWKLVLHLLLVISVTIQVTFYGHDKYQLTNFLIQHSKAFDQYFIRRNCNEPVVTLYTLDDIYKQIDYVANSYYEIPNQAVSSLEHVMNDMENETTPILTMKISYRSRSACFEKQFDAFPFDTNNNTLTWNVDLFPLTNTSVDIPCDDTSNTCCSIEYCDRSIVNQIEYYINKDNIKMVDSIDFEFSFAAQYQEYDVEDYNPVDVKFYISVSLENDLHGSGMSVELEFYHNPVLRRKCNCFRKKSTIVDIFVMTLLIMSSWTYMVSIAKTVILAKDVKLHFLAYHERRLRWQEISLLFNKWFIVMLFTDLLILLAIVLKGVGEYMEYIPIELVQVSCVLLGLGVLLLWCGLFGILSYFESLNVLLITVRLAFPSILRFAICILILFISFALCGWLVIGPYHPKFNGFFVTVESLFCILNGDDLYETFKGIEVRFTLANVIQLFSKFYLCTFIFLFIYIILSLFIGIFNHAYESLSDNWRKRSRGFLRDWAEDEPEDDPSKNYPFPVPTIRTSTNNPCDVEDEIITDSNITEAPTPCTTPSSLQIPEITVSKPEYVNTVSHTGENEYCNVSLRSFSVLTPQDDAENCHDLPRRRHTFQCRRHAYAKSIVAEPPSASKEEVAKARYKLQPNNSPVKEDLEESGV